MSDLLMEVRDTVDDEMFIDCFTHIYECNPHMGMQYLLGFKHGIMGDDYHAERGLATQGSRKGVEMQLERIFDMFIQGVR